MTTTYRLNRHDIITDVSGPWDEFALENDGQEAVADNVLNRPIWDFIHEFEVCAYLAAVFSTSRQFSETIELPYRCDSPKTRRIFSMKVFPLANFGLEVIHTLQRQVAFSNTRAESLELLALHSTKRCSICCALKVNNTWIDMTVRPKGFEFPRGLGLCDKCKKERIVAIKNVVVLNAGQRVRRNISA